MDNKPLEPVKGSWDLEITWREGTRSDEEIRDVDEFAKQASADINENKERLPEGIASFTFRKIN